MSENRPSTPAARLVVCPTPIGNLGDATPRQIKALSEAEIIACEDTRTTGKLLELLGIVRVDGVPRLVSYHEHNERERATQLVEALRRGQRVVLVSDAGTPGISDPGFWVVQAAIEAGFAVEALPGAVAGMVALSASGLPTDHFFFEGFLPAKSSARRKRLEVLDALGVTVVCYESPYRAVEMLEDVAQVMGQGRPVCLARELTKMHEEYLRGTAQELVDVLKARVQVKGECVVILGPRPAAEEGGGEEEARRQEALDELIAGWLAEGRSPRSIKDELAERHGLRKSEAYARIERVQGRG